MRLLCASGRLEPGAVNRVSSRSWWSPLTMACVSGHVGTARALLAAPGIDPNQANQHGDTPLVLAAQARNTSSKRPVMHAKRVIFMVVVNSSNAP